MTSKNNDGWVKVGTNKIWNFYDAEKDGKTYKADGKILIGTFVGRQDGVGANNSTMYDIEKDDGTMVSVWGNTVLDVRLKNVKVGEEVKIEYLGLEVSEKTKRKYHNFDVYHRPAPFKRVEDEANEEDFSDINFDDLDSTPKK